MFLELIIEVKLKHIIVDRTGLARRLDMQYFMNSSIKKYIIFHVVHFYCCGLEDLL